MELVNHALKANAVFVCVFFAFCALVGGEASFDVAVCFLFKPSCQENMRRHIQRYLKPRFGKLPVSAIDERPVQGFITDLNRTEYVNPAGVRKRLSSSSIRGITTVLKLILGKKVWRDWELRLPELPEDEQRILKKLNLPMAGLHAFRHGRVSVLQANNVPSDVIPRWVGHSNLRTTSRYTHFGTDFRQQQAARVAVLNGVDVGSNNSKVGPIGPKKTKLQRKGEAT